MLLHGLGKADPHRFIKRIKLFRSVERHGGDAVRDRVQNLALAKAIIVAHRLPLHVWISSGIARL